MKRISTLCFSLILATQTINAQTFNYLGGYNSQGVPNYLVSPGDQISDRVIARINTSLPERYPVPTYHPEYIRAGAVTDIKLREDADVWITFVTEGAGYLNVLGFYTYMASTPLQTAPRASDITIIFPNVSAVNSGGGLKKGDKVHLGRFVAGTGIGFVLFADGWRNSNVTTGNWTLYSNPRFNPERDSALRHHNVLLRDSSGVVVLGFEDIRRDNSSCDHDFNDALFYVTTNPNGAIDTDDMDVTVGTSGNPSGGNNGGLESNGSLASAIATRNFQRQQKPELSLDKMERYQVRPASMLRGDDDLDQFIPMQPIEDVRPLVSTPSDLLKITNAKQVLSVDYIANTDERRAVVLATKTTDEVYEHTKSICDRLKGATLLKVKNVGTDSFPFQMATLQQADGSIEYAISFSVLRQNNAVSIESNWTVEQFSTAPNCYNFQVWSQTSHWTLKIALDIVAQFTQKYTLNQVSRSNLPKVYVRTGHYENGGLQLKVFNGINANKLTIRGTYQTTETTTRQSFTKEVSLSGAYEETITLPMPRLFDAGFTLANNLDPQRDALYLADGAWGLDYETTGANIAKFEVKQGESTAKPTDFVVERDVELASNVREYVSIYRMLRPAGTAENLSAFKALNLDVSGTSGLVEVVLTKQSIHNWFEQYRAKIWVSENSKQVQIPFSQFLNKEGKLTDVSDLTSIVFTMKGNNQGFSSKQLNIKNVYFGKTVKEDLAQVKNLLVYPNPVDEVAQVIFETTEAGTATIELMDVKGAVLTTNQATVTQGLNNVPMNMTPFAKGMYMIRVRYAEGVMVTKIVH